MFGIGGILGFIFAITIAAMPDASCLGLGAPRFAGEPSAGELGSFEIAPAFQEGRGAWIPAFAGMTERCCFYALRIMKRSICHSRERGKSYLAEQKAMA